MQMNGLISKNSHVHHRTSDQFSISGRLSGTQRRRKKKVIGRCYSTSHEKVRAIDIDRKISDVKPTSKHLLPGRVPQSCRVDRIADIAQ